MSSNTLIVKAKDVRFCGEEIDKLRDSIFQGRQRKARRSVQSPETGDVDHYIYFKEHGFKLTISPLDGDEAIPFNIFETKEATCFKEAPRLGKTLPMDKLKPTSRILKRKVVQEKRESRRKQKEAEVAKKEAIAVEKKKKAKLNEEDKKKKAVEKRRPNYLYPSSTKNYYVPVHLRPGYAEKKEDKLRLREEKRQQKIKEYLESHK